MNLVLASLLAVLTVTPLTDVAVRFAERRRENRAQRRAMP